MNNIKINKVAAHYFNEDCSPIKCPKCDSIKINEKILGMIDLFQGIGPVCETEYICECGECVGHWAYGCWNPQFLDYFLENNKL